MSGLFQFRKLEQSESPVVKFSISPEDALDDELVARALTLENELEQVFAQMLEEGELTLQDFESEDEAEILIPILDSSLEDLEAEEELVITSVYVIDNIFLIAAFVTDPDEEDEEESQQDDEQEWQ